MACETVLIVDDDRSFVDAAALLLEELNYRAIKTYGGLEGLGIARKGGVDIAVIDVHMPDMDGVELAKQLANLPQPIPTILISGDTNTDTVTRCQTVGLALFLPKPLDPEILLESVERTLARSL